MYCLLKSAQNAIAVLVDTVYDHIKKQGLAVSFRHSFRYSRSYPLSFAGNRELRRGTRAHKLCRGPTVDLQEIQGTDSRGFQLGSEFHGCSGQGVQFGY